MTARKRRRNPVAAVLKEPVFRQRRVDKAIARKAVKDELNKLKGNTDDASERGFDDGGKFDRGRSG